MKKHYLFFLIIIIAAAGGSLAWLQTERSEQAQGFVAETQLTRPNSSTSTLGSTDERVTLDPKESVGLDFKLNSGSGKLRFVAPNGGMINRASRHLEIDAPDSGRAAHVDFDVGTSPGRYTLEVSRGEATKILEFWVGPEPPQGQPGPDRTFKR